MLQFIHLCCLQNFTDLFLKELKLGGPVNRDCTRTDICSTIDLEDSILVVAKEELQ